MSQAVRVCGDNVRLLFTLLFILQNKDVFAQGADVSR